MTVAPAVRTQSIRVALGATLVVGVIYALVCAAVITFATVDLTNQIDARLVSSFNRLPPSDGGQGGPQGGSGGGGRGGPGDPDRPFGPQVFVWTIAPDGTATTDSNTPDLPAELHDVTSPETATISGAQVRIAGTTFGGNRIVVAQGMEPVQDTQRTIIFGTLLIAPLLLLSVFFGAVIVGRRVAEPVEAARRRQLEFTADASHELRTPLSVIEAHASLALAHERDTAWYRNAFTKVDYESKRMHRLVEDMLWLARFDAGQTAASSEPVDLSTLVRQSADRFTAVAETRNLTLTVDAPEEPVTVAASADLLDRLIGVLLDNACKYAPDGGRVEVHVLLDGGHPTVRVDDNGPGITDEDRDRIFDRFHRSVETAGQADGAGLGLAIADAVVRATHGRWSVGESPLGGAQFAVQWPDKLHN